ncbi:MAG: hypothetical protein ACTSPD_10350 [Promethearchaeota archaeon]
MSKTKSYIFIRDPNQKDIDEQYIDNCIRSIEEVFIPYMTEYIRQPKTISEAHRLFRQILKTQHKIIVGEHYKGYTKYPKMDRLPSNRIRDDIPIKIQKPILKKEWYREELKNYNLKRGEKRTIVVKSMFPKSGHTIEDVGDGLKLYFPDIVYVDFYLGRMAQIMALISSSYPFIRCSGTRDEIDQLLNLLGWYIHLFVICHPFEKVNFSLCMTQVNYILIRLGHQGISHGYLDFKCFLNDTETVINEFKRMVKWQ